MPATSRPTSKDVAQEAGVSQSTVSLVMGGKWTGRVSPATARSVHEAAERLGYRPNPAARNLRLGRTRTVLLMVPTLTAPFFGPVYTGAARVATSHGFGVVVSTWPDDGTSGEGPFAAPHDTIDGILASSLEAAWFEGDALAGFAGTPAVLLDSGPYGDVPTVDFGVADGMRAVARHLAALGHRRFGHVAAGVDQYTFHARAQALEEVVRDVPGGALLREECEIDVGSAKEAASRLLARPDRPSVLVCDDDLVAAGAYKAARARGLAIPDELSVTGFDDVLLATALEPELTTVRLPAEELGARGMTALLELLGGTRPAPCSLPGRLIVRGSTAPPPHLP